MKTYLITVLVLLSLLGISSCYYDKADLLYPAGKAPCDTMAVVSYSAQIVPLLRQQCLPCHTSASPDGGIVLGIYANDKAIAANGKLLGSIMHNAGYSPMPKGRLKMTACQIALCKKWIDAGSVNN